MRVLICVTVEADDLATVWHSSTVPVTGTCVEGQIDNELALIINQLEGVNLAAIRKVHVDFRDSLASIDFSLLNLLEILGVHRLEEWTFHTVSKLQLNSHQWRLITIHLVDD